MASIEVSSLLLAPTDRPGESESCGAIASFGYYMH